MTIPNTAVDMLLATTSIASVAALFGESSIPKPLLLAGATIPAFQLLRRNWPRSYAGQQQRRTLQQITNLALKTDGPYYTNDFDNEFYFRGLGLPISVPESMFSRFISIARRRQTNARYGTKWSMQWTGKTYRQIKINWVLSEGYFTNEVNPRFVGDEYWACMEILGYARLLNRKGQGDAGHLVGDRGVSWYVVEAKRQWLALLERTTPRQPVKQLIQKFWN